MRIVNLQILFVLPIVVISANSLHAQNIGPRLQSVLQSAKAEEKVSVIITLSDRVDLGRFKGRRDPKNRASLNRSLRQKTAQTQQRLRRRLRNLNAQNVKSLWIINGLAATVPAKVINDIINEPGIETVTLDHTLSAPEFIGGESAEDQWNLNAIRAPDLWALGYTGENVVVASMDTGVDVNHPDLKDNWRGGANSWYDPYGEHESPCDTAGDNSGHGTQTMGIIVGGDVGETAIGVAPDANWIAVKIFNDVGDANISNIHLGFQWLLDPDGDANTDDAPDVVNNSWGYDENPNECLEFFRNDIQTLKAAGIAVICAAGNEGPQPSTSISPANYTESFAVGAVDDSNDIWSYSSRGPTPCHDNIFPNVVAPGVNIKTADLSYGGFPVYTTVSSTSYAAPHLAGAAALLLSAFPDANVGQIEWTLEQTALDLGNTGSDYDYGHGLVDAFAACQLIAVDTDRDCSVTLTDFAVLAQRWFDVNCAEHNNWCEGADMDRNTQVDWLDIVLLTRYWLE
jgi:bacillopeptidase F